MALRLLAFSFPRDDLGTRRGAAAVSVANVERQARASRGRTDDHHQDNANAESVPQAQSPRGAAASKASRSAT